MKQFLLLMVGLLGVTGIASAAPAPYQPKVQSTQVPEATALPVLPPPIEIKTSSLSLQEAIQLAYRYQSNLQVNQAQVEIAAGRERQAAAARNPRISLTSGYQNLVLNRNGFPPELGSAFTPNGWNHGATLSQLLYDFGRTNQLVRSARETKNSAIAALEEYRSQLVLLVSRAFYEALQADRLVQVQQANVVNRQHHLQQARARFEAGLGLPSDVTRAETALASALFNLSQAQTDAASRRLQFNQTLGLDPRVQLELRQEPEGGKSYSSAQELYGLALQRRYELSRYKAAVAAAEAALAAAHVENLPTISSSLAYANRQNPFQESLSLNLNVQFDVLDGGIRSGKIQEMQGTLKQAQAQLTGAEQRVLTEVSQAYLNLKNAEKQIASASSEEVNAAETLRLQEGRYRVGLGVFIDVLDAQSAFLLAQTNRVNAQTSLEIARAALSQAIGEAAPEAASESDLEH